ncbi:MAG: hypothetical protein MK193_02725 [Lentisphaeria bacterium]|nr:hypothetical protein [Lentisphaeria bacterium]
MSEQLLNDQYNPLKKEDLYLDLKIDPYTPQEQLDEEFTRVLEELKKSNEDEEGKEAKLATLKNTQELLESLRHRMVVNSVILDRYNLRILEDKLQTLIEERHEKFNKLPDISMDQLLITGADSEMKMKDFKNVPQMEEMMLGLDEVLDSLGEISEERSPYFDN